MSTRAEILAHAVRAVRPIVIGAADADLASATPCRQWRLAELAQHTLGTLAGLARLGRREALDADDPWGTPTSEEPWSPRLVVRLDDLAEAWSAGGSWEGQVDMGGSSMPAPMVGDMVVAEVLLHGWDLARATGQRFQVSDEVAKELRRGIEETAEMGRQMGAYGPAVVVGDDATDLDRALGAAGRDPGWSPGTSPSVD